VSCVQSITPAAPLVNVTYYITDSAILRYPQYVLSPSGCPNELVYDVTLQNLSPLPSSIQFLNATKTISVYETNYALVANYSVMISVTDPKTGLSNSALTLFAFIKCTRSVIILSGSISSISYQIDLNVPWTLNTTMPVYQQYPSQCAVGTLSTQLVYTGPGVLPTFITQLPPNVISVFTTNTSNVGVYNYQLIATDSLSGLTNSGDSFPVQILMPGLATDLVLVNGTQIANQTYLVNSSMLQLSVPTYSIVPSTSNNNLTYMVASGAPSFIKVVNVTGSFFVQI
jgi:hypothetical protein